MSAAKNPYIDLKASIILTKEGLGLFQKPGAIIKKVYDRAGSVKEGLRSEKYNAPTMQKLIMNSFVEEIYIKAPELLNKRSEIISTNNLVTYAILYKKLSPTLAQEMFASQILKDYNRKNPRNAILELKQIPQATVKGLFESKAEQMQAIEKEIRELVISRVKKDTISEEDKETRIRSLDKFIRWMDPRIWYLYYIIYQTPFKSEMRNVFTRMVETYLDNTQIATHLSNLLLEFIQNAEKAHLTKIIVDNGLAPPNEADKYLRDRSNREGVVKMAQSSKQPLELSWNLNPSRTGISKQFRIQITISNYGLIDEATRMNLSKKMRTDVDGISLSDFYNEGESPEKLGAGLGLLYNSYLEDICKKKGILYKCNIFPEPKQEKTTVVIDITL